MLYTYRAVDRNGKTESGEREAGSERELADLLRRDGFLLLEAVPRTAVLRRWRVALRNPLRRVSLVERMVFARNLAVMIGAGLALTRGLEALQEQSANPKFKEIISSLRAAVLAGKSLAEGLRPYERTFGQLFINMVEAGELSGNLERVLVILARQMKRDHDLRSRVQGAMFYPAVVFVALVAIGTLMMVYVVPTLTRVFAELGTELPITTRIIIASSDALLAYSAYFAGGLLLSAFGAVRLLRTAPGKRALDTLILHTPIFGPLVQKLNAARFARTLSSLLASGIAIARALEVTASVVGNTLFRAALRGAAETIQRGKPLAEILRQHPALFPPLVTQIVQVGEETGTTTRMLLRLALFYEEEVTNTTKNLSSIIEPLLMVVIGGAVGFFAISMIQPIYSSLGNL